MLALESTDLETSLISDFRLRVLSLYSLKKEFQARSFRGLQNVHSAYLKHPLPNDPQIISSYLCQVLSLILGKVSAVSGHVPERECSGRSLQMHHGSLYQVSTRWHNWHP